MTFREGSGGPELSQLEGFSSGPKYPDQKGDGPGMELVGGVADTAEIEEHGASLVTQAHVEAGVPEGRVDEARDEGGAHGDWGAYRVSEFGTSRLHAAPTERRPTRSGRLQLIGP